MATVTQAAGGDGGRRVLLLLIALSGFAAVAAGALAAHGLAAGQAREWMRTGVTYALVHAAAALACLALADAGRRAAHWTVGLFLLGDLLFSGSLYALALGAPAWLGAVVPIGGLAFLAGWATLAIVALRPSHAS